jgi:hypothetical protein
MLFSETVAVYCENHTEHTDRVRTSQETHYVSATKPNRLMLVRETVAVYCDNHTEHRYSPYLTGNTLSLRYKAQPVNAVWGNSRCLLGTYCGNHTEHRSHDRLKKEQRFATDWMIGCCIQSSDSDCIVR